MNKNIIDINKEGWLRNNTCTDFKIIKSDNFNDRPLNCNINLLVIHCISLPVGCYENNNINDLFLNKIDVSKHESFKSLDGLKVSAHFLINRNGIITQYVSTEKRAWHAGVSDYKGVDNCNDFSIGIEMEGTDKTIYTPNQYESLSLLTESIIFKYPEILNNITGHQTISKGRKTDPGTCFDWNLYFNGIKK